MSDIEMAAYAQNCLAEARALFVSLNKRADRRVNLIDVRLEGDVPKQCLVVEVETFTGQREFLTWEVGVEWWSGEPGPDDFAEPPEGVATAMMLEAMEDRNYY